MRAAVVLSVGLLAVAHKKMAAWLEQVFAAEESDAVRVAAALGLAWSMQIAAPSAARALLIRVASTPGTAKSVFEKFPWDAPDIQTYCSEALALTGTRRGRCRR